MNTSTTPPRPRRHRRPRPFVPASPKVLDAEDLERYWKILWKDIVVDPAVVGSDKLECWIWTGKSTSTGYPKISFDGKRERVSRRIGYQYHDLARLEAEAGTRLVMRHMCDRPRCVRPEHLLPGTYRENTRDAMKRDRGIGSKSKVSEEQREQMRREHAEGASVRSLARRYNCNYDTMRRYLGLVNLRSIRLDDLKTALQTRLDAAAVEAVLADLDHLVFNR